mmetsp:Transcript_25868/g.58283  ORF Transcript_25868/g.58283 Transcript_25868/m.58283 type:complete len:598 (-) Transcript_25868:951-2744(-)
MEAEATKFYVEEAKPQGGKIRVKIADMMRAIAAMSEQLAETSKFAARRTIAAQLVRRSSQKRYSNMIKRHEFIPNACSSGVGMLRLETSCRLEFQKLGRMRGGGEDDFSLADLRIVEEEIAKMASIINESSSSSSSAPPPFSSLPDLLGLLDQRAGSSSREGGGRRESEREEGEEAYIDVDWKKYEMENEAEMLKKGDLVEILVRFDRGSQTLFADFIVRQRAGQVDMPVFAPSPISEWQRELVRTADTITSLEEEDVRNQTELLEENISRQKFLERRAITDKRLDQNRLHWKILQSKISSSSFLQLQSTPFTQLDVKKARESLNRIRGEVVQVIPGDPDAQLELGLRFTEGKGTMRDNFKAVKWMRQAVEQDHPLAHCALAVMLATGRGVACVDREAASKLLQRAAGSISIAETLLMDLESSRAGKEWRTIPREVDRIRNVLCKEADENHRTKAFPIASHRLGELFSAAGSVFPGALGIRRKWWQRIESFRQDDQRAMSLFRSAETIPPREGIYPPSLISLGEMFEYGKAGQACSNRKALRMYERAMSAGPTNYSQQRAVTNIDAIRTKGNMDTDTWDGKTSHLQEELSRILKLTS